MSFFIQYAEVDGKQKFYNLGRYPSVSLSDARTKYREIRCKIDKGHDPQLKIVQKHGSVANLFEYYIKYMVNNGKRTWKKVDADLKI